MLIFTDKTPGTVSSFDPPQGYAAGRWQRGDGRWKKGAVRIESGILEGPGDLVGTMAHELAHQHLLGEERRACAKHLRWAPHAVFKQGLRFLHQTSDSSFKPVRLRQAGEDKGRADE